jgi:hypothetical protein
MCLAVFSFVCSCAFVLSWDCFVHTVELQLMTWICRRILSLFKTGFYIVLSCQRVLHFSNFVLFNIEQIGFV